jgi:hypothetical protein
VKALKAVVTREDGAANGRGTIRRTYQSSGPTFRMLFDEEGELAANGGKVAAELQG